MPSVVLYSTPICPSCQSVLMVADHLRLGSLLEVRNVDLTKGEHKTVEFGQVRRDFILRNATDIQADRILNDILKSFRLIPVLIKVHLMHSVTQMNRA